MIDLIELRKISNIKNLNLGQAEKYFYQDVLLFILYKKYARELVFKGGTALSKCYGFDRFSEDLDFTVNDINNLKETLDYGLKDFNIKYELDEKKFKDSLQIKISINGPLFNGSKQSLCTVKLDFSFREKVLLGKEIIKIRPNLASLPFFDVIIMNKKEIFAEKIRAIMTRKQARDLYDLYYLDDSVCEIELINKKLSYYNMSFNKKGFITKLDDYENIWDAEMKYLTKNYPDFPLVKKKISSYFN